MALSSIIRTLEHSPLTSELLTKLNRQQYLSLNGIPRLPKGLVASALAKADQRLLFVVCSTLEEASRWATQLEAMGWDTVHLYPTSEASPYEPFDPESEMTWGQMQVLADLVESLKVDRLPVESSDLQPSLVQPSTDRMAIVATQAALQPHLPPVDAFKPYCLTLNQGMTWDGKNLDKKLAQLGYERVPLVETEGQWSRRGDIVDVFPVALELPVRLEWFGDELEQLREFDPATQRSLDKIDGIVLTPTDFGHIISQVLRTSKAELIQSYLSPQEQESFEGGQSLEGSRRFLGIAFDQPASLLDYLPENTLIVIDEPEQCAAHCDRWVEHAQEQLEELNHSLPCLHRYFDHALELKVNQFQVVREQPNNLQPTNLQPNNLQPTNLQPTNLQPTNLQPTNLQPNNLQPTNLQPTNLPPTNLPPILYLSELVEETSQNAVNLASRSVPVTPHQFAKLAEVLREQSDRRFSIWLVSAQPSRSVALLQEHDCPAQFVPNPRDYPAIDKLNLQRTAVAVKYSGLAELEGFILPTYRIVVVTDREFFGQHTLATPSYIRKRRRAASQQVDPNKLRPGDYVVHKNHGIGQFLKLEKLSINNETREYLVIKYADGLLRVAADQLGVLSRFRHTGTGLPQLHKMSGKTWEKTKNRVRKSIKKVAVDLLKLYAQRAQQSGYCFPPDSPWQQELEDSFPYQPTPDQLKAIQDVKRDLESDRPMDRLVCGDVGFGKTEVAIRAIFKAVTSDKQVAFLAPTTILTQQHYHTIKERFSPYPINVGLLNRFRTPQERRDILQRLKTGELDVVVGTHQLLGKSVTFRELGLLVIDEEQRFGVNQKEKIKSFKTQVDVLTLSATPIPRTLYMSLSGVREMSLITTPPPLRRPIKTHLSPYKPEAVRTAIRMELDRGGQVFYVVPRVEGIEEVAAELREMILEARIAIAHGQLDPAELESIMLTFSNGEADILVCTTIIESGLDIPRVNTILIEDAHKFGLAQLYQLRGRVGRAGIQAHAWLLYPNQKVLSEAAKKRLRAIQEFTQLGSGYLLATRDMEIRGVGNLLGVEQSGQMEAIGFDLYMEMLQEAIKEIQGQEIPQVDDTQIDLQITAFIPADYIPDLDQKISAYRAVAAAASQKELAQIAAAWSDRYGPIPSVAEQLLRVMELKQLGKSLGFARIRPEGKQHIILETPMEEPAWKLLQENLPQHLRSRFVYSPGKVTVRGLGLVKTNKQLESLIEWLGKMQGALPEPTVVGLPESPIPNAYNSQQSTN
ncbi:MULTISPECIES: transcription-repair coupling factor [unclassified Moorena]|uniref:transcription-repair coupling factor n=1 Tax=unclassified Moorena TaxID=2683338 RepID=UPI0013CD2E40|nr:MULTISPECIES: transcription-repair coupling factor [unclassified Moorena]NEO21265.1 transcription-repair coupling factor [Moorena sp. SIO4A5]NEQ56743.1 transcription-repair coupling factor [Moorena sp. SIO4A1]